MNTYGRDVTVPGSSNRPLFARAAAAGRSRSTGIRRVRFTSPHPHDFTPDVIEAMAETPTVCEHIHFPLQSGSDRVLKAMRRSYRRDRYLGWLDAIRAAIPDVAVSTDVIVGFPGRDRGGLRATRSTSSSGRGSTARTRSSTRRGRARAAATYDDQVPKEVVQERFDRLVELQQRISLERSLAQVGGTFEVLVEGAGEARTVDAGAHADEPDRAPARRAGAGIVRVRPDHGGVGAPSDGRAGPPVPGGRGRLRRPPCRDGRRSRSSVRRPWARPTSRSRSRRAWVPRSSRSTRCSSTAGWTSARPSHPGASGRASRTT